MGFAIFLTLALGLVAGIHYYFWTRLIRDPGLAGAARTLATTLLVLLGLSIPVALIVGRMVPPVGRILQWPAFVWLGAMFVLFVVLAGADIVRGIVLIVAHLGHIPLDPSRRTFHARLLAGAVGLVASGVTVAALVSARRAARIRRVEVTLPRLLREMDGFRIAQLSDLHIGNTLGRAFMVDVVERTNALGADLIAITGDLVDGSVRRIGQAVEPLSRLRAPHGVFFVTGNHEYFSGVEEWVAELRRLGIRVLSNERVGIDRGGAGFDLAGTNDHHAQRFSRHGENLAAALDGRAPDREVVLLAHQPVTVVEASRHGVGLQLSGHTHGGQIWPFNYFVYLQQPHVRGQHRVGDTLLSISNGTGYWGPPLRFRAPPEIVLVTLHRGPIAIAEARS